MFSTMDYSVSEIPGTTERGSCSSSSSSSSGNNNLTNYEIRSRTSSENAIRNKILDDINNSKFDPSKLSHYEQEKMLQLFKHKAAIAYLISLGCTAPKSLEDMTKYVMENDLQSVSSTECRKKSGLCMDEKESILELYKTRKQVGSCTPNNHPSSNVCKSTSITNSFGESSELGTKNTGKDSERDCLKIPRRSYTQTELKDYCYLRPGLKESEVDNELKTKVLLPPLNKQDRKKYAEKVTKYFRVEKVPKKLMKKKEHIAYIKECKEQDFKWRDFLKTFELEVQRAHFVSLRHLTIKDIEKTHLGPGLYEVDEYNEKQQKKKSQLSRGFDSGPPRFEDKLEFQNIGPYSYSDGIYKYDNYMKNNGSSRKFAFSLSCNTKNEFRCSDITPSNYDVDGCVDTLLKSKKGVIYPTVKTPFHERRPRSYMATGYYATPQEIPKRGGDQDLMQVLSEIVYNMPGKYPRGGLLEKFYNRNNYYKGKFKPINPSVNPIVKPASDEQRSLDPGVATGSSNITTKPLVGKARAKGNTAKTEVHNHLTEKSFLVFPELVSSEHIGPGSYHQIEIQKSKKLTNAFKSKTPQRLDLCKWRDLEERLLGKNVPLEERLANIVN